MFYHEKQINLLEVSDEYVIAHNIDSGETAMGAGVALALCEEHKNLRTSCKDFAIKNNHAVGETFRYVDGNRVIYNMFTKPHVYFNAQHGMTEAEYLQNQKDCLISLREQMCDNNETSLAIPRIACGLDRCQWRNIYRLILEVFEDTDFEIMVCYI